jgi:hypothetical protein
MILFFLCIFIYKNIHDVLNSIITLLQYNKHNIWTDSQIIVNNFEVIKKKLKFNARKIFKENNNLTWELIRE